MRTKNLLLPFFVVVFGFFTLIKTLKNLFSPTSINSSAELSEF